MSSSKVLAAPGTRRIYSNYGFTVLAEKIEAESSIPFATYLAESVRSNRWRCPAPPSTAGAEAAGYGVTSTVEDLSGVRP